jgi:hypothetical protein
MAHLAVVSCAPVSVRRYIHYDLRRKIGAMPCAVCGLPYFICVDHVVPVACGGSNDESNLQPLCRWCNGAKGHRLTNRDIAREIAKRGLYHFTRGVHWWHTRHENCYGGTTESELFRKHPEYLAQAKSLHAAFIDRVVTC